MNEETYYQEIEHLIKKSEIGKRARVLEENNKQDVKTQEEPKKQGFWQNSGMV